MGLRSKGTRTNTILYVGLMKKPNKNPEQIQNIFQDSCNRHELLIIVTPYLRFETNFVHLDGEEIYVRAMMNQESARYTLNTADLNLRFPYKFSFLEAPSKFLGFGTHDGQTIIKFSLPKVIYENDGRKNFRLELVAQLVATFNTPSLRFVQASVNNISATGAQLTAKEELSNGVLKINDKIVLSIPLTRDININNSAIVRHINGRTFGVEFNPDLPDSIQEPLTSWIFLKREEAYDLIARRSEEKKAVAKKVADSKENQDNEGGILLVTRDNDMYSALSKLLVEHNYFYHALPAIGSMKDALSKKPHLVILHMTNSKLEEKHLIKSLAEIVNEKVPIMLLGTDIEFEPLSQLGQELKAVSSIDWTPSKNVFLQRLVLGILRRHYGHGESPMAPKESES